MTIDPFAPAQYSDEDIDAIKAVAAGNASEGQQRRAIKWIVWSAAATYDETFVPNKPDVSAYLAGRRNVGLQIMKIVNVDFKTATRKGEK